MKNLLAVTLILVLIITTVPTIVNAATEAQKQTAIDNALAWLAGQQQADGRWNYGDDNYDTAATAAAILAFAEEGHTLTSGTAYSSNVANGLNYIFSRGDEYVIGMEPAGNPDVDGDGLGVKFVPGGNHNRDTYVTGLVLPAIVAGGTPSSTVNTGPLNGWTYSQVVRDTVDYFAYGQADSGNARGGWRYYADYGQADNSTSQWPVVGMLYASSWGINAPGFVGDELGIWVDHIQNADGGSDYDHNKTWGSNMSRTGALLIEMNYSDDDATDPASRTAALNYVNSQWNTNANSTWDGNFGHPYAMWSIYKGLETTIGLGDTTTITPRSQGGAVIDAGDTWNWWEDYCEDLVNTQNADGSWSGYSYWTGPLATSWNVNILNATQIPSQPIPEPGTVVLVGSGLLALLGFAVRKRKK